MTGRRLLILSPAFHGYWRSIEDAFERRGYDVRTTLYDAFVGPGAKVKVKVRYELADRVGLGGEEAMRKDFTDRAVHAVRTHDPDVLLVVKGDAFGPDFWSLLEERHQRRALWLYDEVRRTRHTAQSLDAAGPLATYSRHDETVLRAAGHRVVHVPLAHDPTVPFTPVLSDELIFVGARYERRQALLHVLADAGVPVRAHGRDWSGHLTDRLRTWRVRSPGLPSGRDLTRSEAYAAMAGAMSTLNVHSDQDGFTMRTFEAAGVGSVQLIDRADVADLYVPGEEVAVFEDPAELIELARRAAVDTRWSGRIRERARARTLAEHTFDHRAVVLETLWA